MFVVDTNILVYAAHRGASEHDACRKRIDSWRADPIPWAVTWPIVYEFLRVVTHPRVFQNPLSIESGWSFVSALVASPSLQILVEGPRHRDLANLTFDEIPDLRGNLVHDAHTAILMREHGYRTIYTRDTDFYRFPFLEVVDPLRPQGQDR